jgi:hypothetical protein
MRYEKKILVLSSVLAALLLIWAAGLVFSPERSQARSEAGRLLAGKAAEVASISIQEPGASPIELSKSGAAWSLADGSSRFPAQGGRISSFLDDVAAVSRLGLAGRSKDAWASLDLGDNQAKRATLKDSAGKVVGDFYLGGYGPTGSEVFLRREGSDLSYSAESSLSSYFGSGRSSWLDLKVLGDLKDNDLQSFSVKSELALDPKSRARVKLDYEIRREGKGWKLVGAAAAQGVSLDAEAVSALLRSIVGLQGEDYVASPPANAFAQVQARVALELGTGKSRLLEIGAPAAAGGASGEERFYARLEGGPAFLVSSSSLSSILKSLGELVAKSK